VPPRKVPPGKKVPPRKVPVAKKVPPRKAPASRLKPAKYVPPPQARPVKKAPAARESPAKDRPQLPFAPYGAGSARATPDGGGPAGWLVKGRSDTRLYYTPDDPTYDATVAHVWFKDEASAARALFTPWRKSSRK